MKKTVVTAVLIAAIFGVTAFSSQVRESVVMSVDLCLRVIVPSLFGFMIISEFTVKSKLYTVTNKPLRYIARKVFHMTHGEFSVFLLSLIAGYPVGAGTVYALEKDGAVSQKRAENMYCFCVSSGPAFIIGTAGILFGELKPAGILFLSVTASNIILACVLMSRCTYPQTENEHGQVILSGLPAILNSSIHAAAVSLLKVCTSITVFGIVYTLIMQILPNMSGTAERIAASVFEISNIMTFPGANYGSLPLFAALLSFGGICVVFQIAAVTHGRLNLKKFLFSRIIAAGMSAGICKLLTVFLVLIPGKSAPASAVPAVKYTQLTVIPSVLLLIMTAMTLASTDSGVLNRNPKEKEKGKGKRKRK
ncbi:MAG: hypothetical protein LBR54_05045 [Oscillospiraceae bacterium]|jgi:hypothetical protein|nr:hypothetical protein [Oscillospiraceae bacterium]